MPTSASTRIKAQNIKFLINTTEYSVDADSIELATTDAPGATQLFSEVQPLQEWKITISGIASGSADSLFRLLWANYGTQVAFKVAPQGNATATTSAPVYTGTVKFDQLPPLNMSSNEIMAFSTELTVVNDVHTPAATPPVYFGLTLTTS
jgi:hypothetical protein